MGETKFLEVSAQDEWVVEKQRLEELQVESINMGRLAVFSYTSSHLFLHYHLNFALSYSLILLKSELRFLTPCPTCVHIIFMQQDLPSCVCVHVCM